MKIIKRNGSEEEFNGTKIYSAIEKANKEVVPEKRLNKSQIRAIQKVVTKQCEEKGYSPSVEEIQNLVEIAIMSERGYEVAQKYVRYRFKRELARKANTTDEAILSLIENNNEEIKQENSNKDSYINSVQRDYMAGEVSKDLCKRLLYPEDIIEADKAGLLHVHDKDYVAMREYNCWLVNLKDMLNNGTNISGVTIETPKSFKTACNIATQIVAQVASNQYGLTKPAVL